MLFRKDTEAWLVVGLGNPGKDYERTRHNCGFQAIERLASSLNCKIDKGKFSGLYGKAAYCGKTLYLLKPLTYMNLSGQSVLQASAYFKISPEHIIVMFDDISLEPGLLRLRNNGSAGGHNGIKSIINELGSQDFPRVKIGVGGKPNPNADLADWVLSGFTSGDAEKMDKALNDAGKAALCYIEKGYQTAANLYNGSK